MILLVLACSTDAPKASSERSLEETLTAAVELDIEATGATAAAVSVIRNGEQVWSGGFGSHTKDGTPVTADTMFRVASLTKPMTAIAALQQVDEGCLAFSSAVDSHILDFEMQQQPGWAADLTVADTLRMTGGLADYQLQSGEDGDGEIDNFLEVFLQYGYFLSPPGRMYNYSNMNYVVAGRLVELCVDDFFRPYVEENVWNPLGMHNSEFSTEAVVNRGNYALGVTTHWPEQMGEEIVVDAESFAASHLWPAMGAWSSVNDLTNLALFLLHGNNDVLSSSLHQEMISPQADTLEGYADKSYGYGLVVKTGIDLDGAHYPVTMLSHVGSIYGSSAHIYVVPELDIGVVAIFNRDNVTPINSVLAALEISSHVSSVPSEEQPLPELDDYQGTYFNEFNIGDIVVTATKGTLTVDIPALNDAGVGYIPQLEAVRPDNFLLHHPDGGFDNLSFIRDESGAVEYLRQRNYVGLRTEETAATAQQRQSQAAPQDVWRQFEAHGSVFQ